MTPFTRLKQFAIGGTQNGTRSALLGCFAGIALTFSAAASDAQGYRTYTLGGAFDDAPITLTVCGSRRALRQLDRALGQNVYGTMLTELGRLNNAGDCWVTNPIKQVRIYDVLSSQDVSNSGFYQRMQQVEFRCGKDRCFGMLIQGPFGGWADATDEIVGLRTGVGIVEFFTK